MPEKSLEHTTENFLDRACSLSSITLSSKSRNMLVMRIIIFFSMLIFLPLETISSEILISFEKAYIINYMSEVVSVDDIFKHSTFRVFSSFLSLLFADRDTIIFCNSCLYMISHPFKIIKIIIVTNMGYYLVVLLRLLYKENRPYWNLIDNNNVLCSLSYASPSLHLFIPTFYWTYLFIQYCIGNKEKISKLKKFWLLFGILMINLITSFNLFINFQNYIYQLNYGLVISLVLVCIFLDLESKIHNFLLKTMKNVYKIRKYKIQLFLFILFILIFSTIIYNFMENDSLNIYISNIMTSVKFYLI